MSAFGVKQTLRGHVTQGGHTADTIRSPRIPLSCEKQNPDTEMLIVQAAHTDTEMLIGLPYPTRTLAPRVPQAHLQAKII